MIDATKQLSSIEAELNTASDIYPISARLKVSYKLMGMMDDLYNPLLSEGTLYSRRRKEARDYGGLMHNARTQHSILGYRAKRHDELAPGAEVPEHISAAAMNVLWDGIMDLLVSGIKVLHEANTQNITEGIE